MPNPILQALNINPQRNNILQRLSAIKDPKAMYSQMLQTNPQFKSFVEANKNKSINQIAKENNIDINFLNSIINGR